jgi:glycosyltransferase involved in cell wall biosynthesis
MVIPTCDIRRDAYAIEVNETEQATEPRSRWMRLAIVALNAYPAIAPRAGNAVGGLETFAWSLSRTLARDPAHQVQIVVRHTSRPSSLVVDGVEVFCDVERLRGIRRRVSQAVKLTMTFPWLRVNRFRPGLVWEVPLLALAKLVGTRRSLSDRIEALLTAAQPDVVLALGVGEGSAAAVQAARKMGVPVWFWVRSNSDLDGRFLSEKDYVDPNGVTSIETKTAFQADGILCQTQWQRDRVQQLLHRDAVVIPNPVDAERFPVGEASREARKEVLWIGRYDLLYKRPHLAMEVARLCPHIPFHCIINPGAPEIEESIRSHCPPNVRISDYVPRDKMPEVFRASRLFCFTGSDALEGFPNVLLEAASSGTPIVSLEEFDHFLKPSHAGVNAGHDVARLAELIRELWEMPAEWYALSQSGAEYVRREHTLDQCVRRLCNVISGSRVEDGGQAERPVSRDENEAR